MRLEVVEYSRDMETVREWPSYVESVTVTETERANPAKLANPLFAKQFWGFGENHREEEGMYLRDFSYERMYVEVSDVEALFQLMQDTGSSSLRLRQGGGLPQVVVTF